MKTFTKKQIISLLLVFAMLFNFVPFSVLTTKVYAIGDGYSATINDDTIDCGTAKPGYTNSEYVKYISISNTGTNNMYYQVNTLVLSGTNADCFEVSNNSNGVFVAGITSTNNYFVRPVSNLASGTYTATITYNISDDFGNTYEAADSCTVTFTVSDHNFSNEWTTNQYYHWHACLDNDCNAEGNKAEHDNNVTKNSSEPTFDTDGYTGDKYCSVCDYKVSNGTPIAAGKYIRESRATMTPATLTAGTTPSDYTIASTEPAKYTAIVGNWWDLTTSEQITSSTELIKDHEYRIVIDFAAIDPYVYNQTESEYGSDFYLNGEVLGTTLAVAYTTYRKYDATCTDGNTPTTYSINCVGYDITNSEIAGGTVYIETDIGSNNGSVAFGSATENTNVTINAVASSGYEFVEWRKNSPGDPTATFSTTANHTFNATEGVWLYAIFQEIPTHILTLVPAKDATCSATGNNAYYTCSSCDKVFTDALGTIETTVVEQTIAINPFAHSWDTGEITTPATCTSEGVKTYTCTHNGAHTKTESIDKIAHTIVHVDEEDETCTTDGNDAYYKCSVCDKYFIDALGASEIADKTSVIRPATDHNWGEWIETTPATENADGEETRTCTNNSAHTETRPIPKLSHTHSLVKTNEVPATCTSTGTKAYWTCSSCHKMFRDSEGTTEIDTPAVIQKIEHSWDAGVIKTEPTCTSEGEKTYTCTECLETKTEQISKKFHILEIVSAVAPTCETAGIKAHYKCSECAKLFADSLGTVEMTTAEIVVSATGHDWGEWVETTPATVDSEGVKTRTCKHNNSHKDTDTILKLALEITNGKNAEYTLDSNSDVTIKCNGTFSKFKELQLDGAKINSSNYTAESGSTKVTLKSSYLNTLAEGNYTLKFVYNDDRTAETTLTIAKANTNNENNNTTGTTNNSNSSTTTETTSTSSSPKTGDNIIIWISLLLISALGVIGTIKFIKKRD